MKTNLKLVKIDVTHHWNEDFLRQIKAGKVFDYCLYDSSQATHCCEFTPSYWLVPVYSETEHYLDDAQHEEFSYHNNLEGLEPFYMHCHDVENLEHIDDFSSSDFEYEKSEDEKEYSEQFEEAEDCLRCNPVY